MGPLYLSLCEDSSGVASPQPSDTSGFVEKHKYTQTLNTKDEEDEARFSWVKQKKKQQQQLINGSREQPKRVPHGLLLVVETAHPPARGTCSRLRLGVRRGLHHTVGGGGGTFVRRGGG